MQNLRQSASDETDEKETRSLEGQWFVPLSLTSDSKQVFLLIACTNARVDTCSIHDMHSTFEGTRLSRTHYELRGRSMKSPESLELSWELVVGLVSFLIMRSDELESEWSTTTTTQVDGAGQPALAMASILEHEIYTTSPRCKHNVGTNFQFEIIFLPEYARACTSQKTRTPDHDRHETIFVPASSINIPNHVYLSTTEPRNLALKVQGYRQCRSWWLLCIHSHPPSSTCHCCAYVDGFVLYAGCWLLTQSLSKSTCSCGQVKVKDRRYIDKSIPGFWPSRGRGYGYGHGWMSQSHLFSQ